MWIIFASVEDKLKDKLAIAAKEKLAAANKEKLIQAERKRKAAMFAAMLKSSQQDQQLQQQTAAQRAQAAVQAGGEDPAAGIPPPVMKGNNPPQTCYNRPFCLYVNCIVRWPVKKGHTCHSVSFTFNITLNKVIQIIQAGYTMCLALSSSATTSRFLLH